MTAKAFKETVQNIPELKEWFYDSKNSKGILHETRSSSKEFIDKTKVDFYLTKNQLTQIIGNADTASAIFQGLDLLSQVNTNIERLTGNSQETFIFKEVTFKSLNDKILGYLEEAANLSGTQFYNAQDSNLLKEYDKGHVYGWANTLVERTRQSIQQKLKSRENSVPQQQIDKELVALNKFIDSLQNILEQYDEAASGVENITSDVYAKYRKTSTNWLITWQANTEQQAQGGKVGTAIGKSDNTGVRGFLKNVVLGSSKTLVEKALQGVVDSFVKQGIEQKGSKNLLNLETSPPILKMIADDLTAALTKTKKKLKTEYTGELNNILALPVRRVINKEKAKASIKVAKKQLDTVKTKIKSTRNKIQKNIVSGRADTNIIELQTLLDANLVQTIKQNMGSGNRRDILNLRSGRFAESVSIERLTESRQGMITAFYTYMRNPYATFSRGGQQERPFTRDPHLLIAKSIRQIAQQIVSERLRAVPL